MAVLRCREPFAYDDKNGVQRVLRPGDLVSSDDPAVKGREVLFEPVEATVSRSVARESLAAQLETATAAPGERRTRSRRSTKKDADSDSDK